MAWFCSNPERDDRVTSTTSNRNTASPARASSRRRSRMHRPRERLPVPLEKLALPNALLTNLDAHGLRVKQARAQWRFVLGRFRVDGRLHGSYPESFVGSL
jgi:hypothetical protein